MHSIDTLTCFVSHVEKGLLEVEKSVDAALSVAIVVADVKAAARSHVLCEPHGRLEYRLLQLLTVLSSDSKALLIVVCELEGALVETGVFARNVDLGTIEAVELVLGQDSLRELSVGLEVYFEKRGLILTRLVREVKALAGLEQKIGSLLDITEVLEGNADVDDLFRLGHVVQFHNDRVRKRLQAFDTIGGEAGAHSEALLDDGGIVWLVVWEALSVLNDSVEVVLLDEIQDALFVAPGLVIDSEGQFIQTVCEKHVLSLIHI